MTFEYRLAGKVALVTGGSRGIGAASAKRLAAEGAAVALTYVKDAESAAAVVAEIEALQGRAFAFQADSADPKAVRGAVEATVDRFGQLDVLVNNAGILVPGLIENYDLADFDRMLAVNVRAPFVAIQAAVPHMRAGGRIINISSNVAHRNSFPGSSVYTMTKSALDGLTRGLAHELGQRGITINAVNPGPTETEMSGGAANPALRARITSMIAVGRIAQPEEVAAMVAYLAGPETSYVTGARLLIDGGMST